MTVQPIDHSTEKTERSQPEQPRETLDLGFLVKQAISSQNVEHVYALDFSGISDHSYQQYRAQIKTAFGRGVSVKRLDQERARAIRAASPEQPEQSDDDDDDFPRDAGRLCSSPSGDLYYSQSTGYLCKRGKRWRILLSARTEFERYASGDDPDEPQAFIEAHFYIPETEIKAGTVLLSRPKAKDLKCWQNLEGQIVELPGDEKDSLLTYKAISAHATILVQRKQIVLQKCVRSFGWHSFQDHWFNVRVNGCIGAESILYGNLAPMTVKAPKSVLQRLPERSEIEQSQIDGAVFLSLLNFWKEDNYLFFPLAALFGCARIMLPHIEDAGRVDWQLENFGKTGFHKTTAINFFLATFFGDYHYNSPTEITDSKLGDTGVGKVWKEARLQGVAYMDVDYRYKPGQDEESRKYELSMERRLESLGKTRNKAGGGEKGRSHGDGSDTRPDAGGLLIRTGEADPHEYSIAKTDDESTDAGACTFKYFGDSTIHREARVERSKAIEKQRRHLLGLGVLWTQWLARMTPERARELFSNFTELAEKRIERRAKAAGYTHVHQRTYNYLRDMLVGYAFFSTFLADCAEQITSARAIRAHISTHLDAFLDDRLLAAETLALNYLEHRGGATTQDSLARRIGNAFYQEIKNGHIHLVSGKAKDASETDPSGLMPVAADMPDGFEAYPHAGYMPVEADGERYKPGGSQIGIITRSVVYISGKDFHDFLKKKVKNCPAKLDCLKALEHAGAIHPAMEAGKKRYTSKFKGQAGPRYIPIDAWLIYGEEEDTPPSETPGSAHTERSQVLVRDSNGNIIPADHPLLESLDLDSLDIDFSESEKVYVS